MDDLGRLKERMKDFWALGDYPEVAKRFVPAAEALVTACDIGAGDRVLDVAGGGGHRAGAGPSPGALAVAAASTGARVIAIDFAPTLLAAGRERAAALGLDVRWEEADAEDLPFAD